MEWPNTHAHTYTYTTKKTRQKWGKKRKNITNWETVREEGKKRGKEKEKEGGGETERGWGGKGEKRKMGGMGLLG